MRTGWTPCRITKILFAFCALGGGTAAGQSSTEGYPSRPVKIVIPYPTGGITDIVGRAIGEKLAVSWGQSVVVENRSGANGIPGTQAVATARADGYTIGLVLATHAINPLLYSNLPYRTDRDLIPISLVAEYPFLLVVTHSLRTKTTSELISLARSQPGALAFASSGNGSGPHFALEMLKSKSKVDITHVPYKGAGPALVDVAAGQVQGFFSSLLAAQAMLKSGKVKILAVTSEKRSPLLPEIPAIAETIPGYAITGWLGLIAPASTPPSIISKLSNDVSRIVKDTDVRARLSGEGAEPRGTSPSEFSDFLRSEHIKFDALIKNANVRVE
jgi:tripartite-type tricarboxylate transporter receptor subunit TctC